MKFMNILHGGRCRLGVSRCANEYVVDIKAAYELGRNVRQLAPAPVLAAALFPDDLVGFIANGPESEQALQFALAAVDRVVEESGVEALMGRPEPIVYRLDEIRFGPPVLRPGKVLGIGLNYRAHAEETGRAAPKQPMFFNKFASSLTGSGEPIVHPGANITTQIDFEAELAVVIGRPGRFIKKEQALEHVFGYTIMNDVSARDLQYVDGQFVRGKALDTFGPIGPWIVSADTIRDPQNLHIQTRINGELMQDGHTSDMIFSVAELISVLSDLMTLEPGDIIMTGTPAGVGVARTPQRFLQPGDVVDIFVEQIGNLINRVEAAPA